jgi:hypothetical protein
MLTDANGGTATVILADVAAKWCDSRYWHCGYA